VQLRKALESVFAQEGAVLPTKVRFFRGQMTTIISRALSEMGIKPLPSRRCFSIMSECSWGGLQCWLLLAVHAAQGCGAHCSQNKAM
jgi:hypothetical protein